jgi:gentisate 1,2-dioxygenase
VSVLEANSEDPRITALHRRMAQHSLGGHWQTRAPRAELKPFVWSWSSIYSCLMESGEVIQLGGADDAANRRTVQLVNPGIVDQKSTSRTLQMSVQLVKPGETAECHRHSAAALRFIVEGDGSAFTNVNGEKMSMEPGDLVLTPNWTWHDHQNPGDKPVVWLDVLDIHLTNHLDAAYRENFSDAAAQDGNYFKHASQPIVKPDGYCRQRYGTVRARVADQNGRAMPFTYKWRDTLQALKGMALSGEKDPFDGILLEYANPLTGGPTMPTIGCRAQWLGPGESTRPHSHTSSTIYHVVQGRGATTVGKKKDGGEDLAWDSHDCFFVPSKHWHRHRNASKTEPAILFSVTDRPVLDSLGLYREEQG